MAVATQTKAVATQPKSRADLVEEITEKTIVYGLVRRHDPQRGVFDYVLRAHLPLNNCMEEIVLDQELGRVLGSYWKQNDYGTFLGRHCMDWILRHLRAGVEI